nr:unnamed protein product [Spirometra erinaceieuropaei]
MDRQFRSKFSIDRYFPSYLNTDGSQCFSFEQSDSYPSSTETLKCKQPFYTYKDIVHNTTEPDNPLRSQTGEHSNDPSWISIG